MSTRFASLGIAVALAGCNALLGIDDVTGRATDRDGDGILDDADNCPDRANPLQVDRDHDGIGDICNCTTSSKDDDHDGVDDGCDECVGPGFLGVDGDGDGVDDGCTLVCPNPNGLDSDADGIDDGCDACLSGPPHDEDQDGIADACDVCPSIVDPAQQLDVDGDEIGGQCDASPFADDLVLFDPFTSDDPTAWASAGAEFTVTGDGLVFDGPAGYERQSMFSLTGVEMTAETLVTPGAGISAHPLGLFGSDSCVVDESRYLVLTHERNFVAMQTSALPVPGDGPVRLRFWVSRTASEYKLHCDALDAVGAPITNTATLGSPTGPSGPIGVIAKSSTARWDYFWLVQRRP
ncbi:MAG: hypothetical protein HOV81_13610 [Kofleriaceae bacterium]|nr:hypothetical protein [Kofleriaceae bacterium]